MGILSLFKRPHSDKVARALVEQIVLIALRYSKDLEHPDSQRSATAGAEVIYLLLHLLDAELFAKLGATRRDALFDSIAQSAITRYTRSILLRETPNDLLFEAAKIMQDDLNSRQITYFKCKSIIGDPLPSIGTIVFAFCFYVHRALGHTSRTEVEDILTGDQSKFTDADLRDFPSPAIAFRGAIWLGSTLEELRLQSVVKYLR